MEQLRKLDDFDSKEIRKFLDSFDTILTDCDGVLWLGHTPIEGSLETLKKLQSLGKKVFFVSNNSTHTVKEMCGKLRNLGYAVNTNQIALSSSVICWYLKKLGFNGKAFVLGTRKFRQVLKNQGIDVSDPCSDVLEERIEAVVSHIRDAPHVDAVIVDIDINMNWAKMTRAIEYLKNREIMYFAGAHDRHIAISEHLPVLGNADFIETISKESNRMPVQFAKSSEAMKNYIMETFEIVDPARCIFVGDSLDTDMKFADLCGFGKFWVTSGVDSLGEMTSRPRSTFECHSSHPFYYLPKLGLLSPLLDEFISPDCVIQSKI